MKSDINQFISCDAAKDLLYFVTAGSVDDGKSTLIGRLLHDSKMIYEDHLKSVKDASLKASSATGEIDMSFFTDGLKAEREQGITIDVAYRYFTTAKRKFIIIDCPGHEQYTRNMATGASNANLSLILIDAQKGMSVQSRRHAFICSLLGIPHMVVVINKMDKIGYSQKTYERIRREFENFAAKLSVPDLHFIPVSALKGDNVVEKSPMMKWFKGTPLLEYLENVYVASDRNLIDLRFPVQYVIKDDDNHRYYAGRIASGVIRKGDSVKIMSSGRTTRISRISLHEKELKYAFASQSVGFETEDEVDISSGDVIVHPNNLPAEARCFEAMIISLSESPVDEGTQYRLKNYARTAKAVISKVHYRIDVNTLRRKNCKSLLLNEIGRATITSSKPLFHDSYARNRKTGAFILIDPTSNNTVACGMIIERGVLSKKVAEISCFKEGRISGRTPARSLVTEDERERIFKQKACTVWLTGLLSSGKREIACELEKLLVESGHPCVVLDGGRMRRGVDMELDFSKQDITEHVRRAAEMAKIINECGIICICSFVSPESSVREQARKIVGNDKFIEVFADASPEWCAMNDTTGLYKKACGGELGTLAGVSSKYERPTCPDIMLFPEINSASKSAKKLFDHMIHRKLIH